MDMFSQGILKESNDFNIFAVFHLHWKEVSAEYCKMDGINDNAILKPTYLIQQIKLHNISVGCKTLIPLY
jgi:hypothetical protein